MTDPFIYRFLSKLDLYGASVNLQLEGDRTDKNAVGAFISIAMLAIAVGFTFNSLLDCVKMTNPKITDNIEYGTANLTFNKSNFFFAISFYTPLSNVSAKSAGVSTNDLASVKYINQLNITCTTCGNDTNSTVTTLMNLCNADTFTNLTLKSMPAKKSQEITAIFNQFSFCIPEDLTGTIMDNTDVNSTMESSMQLYIPVNNISIEYTEVKQNSEAMTGEVNVIAASTVTATVQPAISQQSPSTTTTATTNKTQTSSNQTPGTGTPQQQTTQPNSGSQQTNQQGTTVPVGQNPTQTQNPTPTQTNPTNPTTIVSNTTTTTTTPTPTSPTLPTSTTVNNPPLPGRLLTSSHKPRNLAITYTGLLSNVDYLDKDVNNIMSTNFKNYKFPKMLIMHKSLEISPSNKLSEIYKTIYNLDVLDYQDPLTGNKLVYDVYIQRYSLYIETWFSLFSSSVPIEFLVIQRIEKNVFDSLENTGAYLTFKLYSDSVKINVTYVSFIDVIQQFGGFYSTLALAAVILSELYNEVFLKRRFINTLFKFVDNEINVTDKYSNSKRKESGEEFYIDRSNGSIKHYNIEAKKATDGVEIKDVLPIRDNYIGEELNEKSLMHNQRNSREVGASIGDYESSNKERIILNPQINKVQPNIEVESLNNKNAQDYLNQSTKFRKAFGEEENNLVEDIHKNGKTFVATNIEYRQIFNSLKSKKKLARRSRVKIMEYFCMFWCCGLYKGQDRKRFNILKRCSKIIHSHLQIDNVFKKLFEIEYLKRILLTERQRKLLKYQFRYINFSNYEGSMKFLDIIDDEDDEDRLDEEVFSNKKNAEKLDSKAIDAKLLEGLKYYYNF